jgi:hypothetical protein
MEIICAVLNNSTARSHVTSTQLQFALSEAMEIAHGISNALPLHNVFQDTAQTVYLEAHVLPCAEM